MRFAWGTETMVLLDHKEATVITKHAAQTLLSLLKTYQPRKEIRAPVKRLTFSLQKH